MTKKNLKILKWTTRILALALLIFALPFYFGYGNPLPFINPEYSLWDNLWLTIFPIMFIGLAIGWKYEKIGGYMASVPILIGMIIGLIIEGDMAIFMGVPLLIGVGYLIVGYQKQK